MANSTWKQTERQIARRLGGKRTGPTGRHGPDILTDWLAAEVKHRKALPEWLKDALAQAQAGAGERLAIVVLHQAGSRHDDDLVILHLGDFQDWFGRLEVTRED